MILVFALALLQEIGGTKPPAVGQVLVATEKSHDPDLARSVILVIHADGAGVMGLILNRPRDKTIYFGGPIALGARALFRSRTKLTDAAAEHIVGDVYMVSRESSIPKDADARIYAGYVGWSAQQLSGEIAQGLWKIARADAAMVFDPHPESLWRRSIR